MTPSRTLGLSGRIARTFEQARITLLIGLLCLLSGVFAIVVTPREEEPQISVTFANVFIAFPGASAREVESLIATPAEQVLSEIEGVEHVYSSSRPGLAVVTVEFRVGENETNALVRLYSKVYSHQDWLPSGLGVAAPIVKPKSIDDVPIVTLTLWSEDHGVAADDLARIAHALEAELKRVPGTREVYTVGAPSRVVHVLMDPVRMAGHGIAVDDLRMALAGANSTAPAGQRVVDNTAIVVQAGAFLSTPDEVAALVVGVHDGAPVHVGDVADVELGPDQPESYVWHTTGRATPPASPAGTFPAVTLAIAKQAGTNATRVAERVRARVDAMREILVPASVHVTVTRDYGASAADKAHTLIKKLAFATFSVIALVLVTMGPRAAAVVGVTVVVTLLVTLFASWIWGFTINRVSLFALIFSIGILVDDAIVVVENIVRHRSLGDLSAADLIPVAVDEVGGPTILATLTVIAALLPMAFVRGLMGPYMSPIPINASTGMALSLAVAFVIAPWLARRLLLSRGLPAGHDEQESRLGRMAVGVVQPLLAERGGARQRWLLLVAMLLLLAAALATAPTRAVVFKMLPFDNKSEFQIVVDMPEGTAVEQTAHVLSALGASLADVPEVRDWQAYAGTAAPVGFNGLVRQYYLRTAPELGELQVNLVARHERTRRSHDIARSVRARLAAIAEQYGATVRVVEVPPGPPVLAPLVAEIYGPDAATRSTAARTVRRMFESTPDIVDIDDSLEAAARKQIYTVDRERAGRLGVQAQNIVMALEAALAGSDVTYLHEDGMKYATPIRIELPESLKSGEDGVGLLRLRSSTGGTVPLAEVATPVDATREGTIWHKDLQPLAWVTGDAAGAIDSPLYGMAAIAGALDGPATGAPFEQYFVDAPQSPRAAAVKWDGEWRITYETFRDMGLAYAVGLTLIYLLLVAQFGSYLTPLIVMSPIPLTIIGILPGHALLGAQFTATSMIGMIALAGIIVRNSILLVDHIQRDTAAGLSLNEAVAGSVAARTRPILLTALAAILGASFIVDDPIFGGLAISLIFGILVSTLLTLVVIPALYYAVMRRTAHPA